MRRKGTPEMTDGEFGLVKAGPVVDRLVIWPLEEGRYGLDATFQAITGYDRAHQYEDQLGDAGIKWTLVQELGGGWTLRFGPVTAGNVKSALDAFVS